MPRTTYILDHQNSVEGVLGISHKERGNTTCVMWKTCTHTLCLCKALRYDKSSDLLQYHTEPRMVVSTEQCFLSKKTNNKKLWCMPGSIIIPHISAASHNYFKKEIRNEFPQYMRNQDRQPKTP